MSTPRTASIMSLLSQAKSSAQSASQSTYEEMEASEEELNELQDESEQDLSFGEDSRSASQIKIESSTDESKSSDSENGAHERQRFSLSSNEDSDSSPRDAIVLKDKIKKIVSKYKATNKIRAISLLLDLFNDNPKIDPSTASLLVLQIGFLTNESLQYRDFHSKNLSKGILSLIERVNQQVLNKQMNPADLVNAITGIAKLHLSSNIPIVKDTIEKLYAALGSDFSQYSLPSLVNLIFLSIHFDKNMKIYKDQLPAMIKATLDASSHLKGHFSALLAYSLAVLDCNDNFRLDNKQFNTLVHLLEYKFKKFKPTEGKRLDDMISLNQIYLAFIHLQQKYPEKAGKRLLKHIAKLELLLDQEEQESNPSLLQEEIVSFIRKSIPDVVQEKRFEALPFLPVDGYFQVDENQAFILQVDGPTHFLHDEKDNTFESQKQIFRDSISHKATGLPILSISYLEWSKQFNDEKRFSFIKEKLAALKIELPPQEWTVVNNKSPKRHSVSASTLYGNSKGRDSFNKKQDAELGAKRQVTQASSNAM